MAIVMKPVGLAANSGTSDHGEASPRGHVPIGKWQYGKTVLQRGSALSGMGQTAGCDK